MPSSVNPPVSSPPPDPGEQPPSPHVSFRKHPAEFLLKAFADVRPEETTTVLLLTLNVFLLLTAYYLLKVAREPLILSGNAGAEVKAYASLGQSLLLVLVVTAYGWLAKRLGRMPLIGFTFGFFIVNLLAFAVLGYAGVAIAIPFFLWVGIFNVTVIAQVWSFAADIYRAEQGKRLFPILGIGSSVGAVAGAAIAAELVSLGPFALMLLAAVLLLVCVGITWFVNGRERRNPAEPGRDVSEPIGETNGFSLILRDKYLLLIGALILVLNCVNKTGEYVLDRSVIQAAHAEAARSGMEVRAFIGQFKANYFAYVNVLGVTLQLFVASRMLKYLGVRRTLLVMPFVSLVGYGALEIVPVISLALAVKVAENGLDYSIASTANQTLWLFTSREAKYKAKQVIDTFLVRAGDVFSAGIVWLGVNALSLSIRGFVATNLALIGLWIFVVIVLGREHARRAQAEPEGG